MVIIAHLWRNISYHFIISIEWGLEQTLNTQSTHMSIESWVNIMSRKVNTRHHSMKGKLLMTQTLWTLKFHNFNKNHWWKRTEQLVSERPSSFTKMLWNVSTRMKSFWESVAPIGLCPHFSLTSFQHHYYIEDLRLGPMRDSVTSLVDQSDGAN